MTIWMHGWLFREKRLVIWNILTTINYSRSSRFAVISLHTLFSRKNFFSGEYGLGVLPPSLSSYLIVQIFKAGIQLSLYVSYTKGAATLFMRMQRVCSIFWWTKWELFNIWRFLDPGSTYETLPIKEWICLAYKATLWKHWEALLFEWILMTGLYGIIYDICENLN